MHEFQALVYFQEEETFANERMLKISRMTDTFSTRVTGFELIFEKRTKSMNGDVTILIDGRRKCRPTVLVVKIGEIGAATEKADSKWGASDDHGFNCC